MLQNLVQDGGINAALQRRLGMDAAPAPALAPELFPVYPAGEYTADLNYLANVRLCMGGVRQPSVAAQQTFAKLNNPLGSGIIAVVSMVSVWNDTRTDVFGIEVVTPVTGFGATAGTRRFRDGRIVNAAANALPVCTVVGGTVAGGVPVGPRHAVVGSTGASKEVQGSWVLKPNSALEIVFESQAEAGLFGFYWTERRALPAEL